MWRLRGDLLHPQIAAQLEARPNGLVLNGLRANLSLLEPYLKADLSGNLSGDLVLPNYDPLRAQGNLSGTFLRGADTLNGAINATNGNWSVNLLGTLLEKPIRVQGNVYPRASAQLRWDGLTGQLEGNLEQNSVQRFSARVQGRTFERTVDLRAQYAAGQVSASGVVDGVRVKANATLENGIKGTLEASALDLRPLTGLAGNLELKATFENLNAKGTARGQIQGYSVNAPLEYADGKLNSLNATLEGLLSVGRPVTASVSGQLYPALDLDGKASMGGDLPAQASFKVGGELSAPTATASGTLETSQIALGTDWRVKTGPVPFSASLQKNILNLQLEGTRIRGSATATFKGGFKLLEVQSRLKDVALEGQNTAVSASGTLGWTPVRGLSAKLQASGTVLGQAAALTVDGTSSLELSGTLGQGRFKAALGRDLLDKPSGTVTLERIDVARFWGRPDALGLSAKVELGGSYARPTGVLSGTLNDTKNVLSGLLEGEVSPQFARVLLKGSKLQGEARWSNAVPDGWSARLTSLGADVSHLLPLEWNYGQVWLGGDLHFSPTALEVKGLDLRVQNSELGKLRALGDLNWTDNEPVGKLRLEGLGGSATLEGKLSAGVALNVNTLNLSRWNIGRVSGAATLRGVLENPTLEGAFQVAGRYAKGEIQVSGRVLDPQISAKGEFLEGAKGQFTAQLSNLKLDPPGARVSLKAQLSEPVQGNVSLEAQEFDLQKQTARIKLSTILKLDGNALEANLNGIWPALEGTAQVSLPQLEAPVKIVGQGNGTYTLEAGTLGAGTVALEQTGGLIPRIRASVSLEPLNLLAKDLRQNIKGNATVGIKLEGDPLKPTVTLEGSSQALEYSGVKLDDLRVTGGGRLENWSDFSKLNLALEQKGQSVGQANLNSVTLEGLRASALSSTLTLSGNYGAKGADFGLSSTGQFSGRVAGNLKGEVVSAEYSLGYGSYGVKGKVQTQLGGARALSGTAQVSGLPADVVAGPADFTLSGTLDQPTLRSSLNLLGAAAKLEARLDAGLSSASLEFADGPQTKAQGTLFWKADKLGGEITLERKLNAGELSDPIKATLGLSGTLENPQAKLSAQYRDVALSGNGSLESGNLQVRTRTENGTLSWKGSTVTSDVRDFDLSSLNLPGYSGVLGLVGGLDLGGRTGKLDLKLENLKTPFTIPYLDLELAGSANGTLELGQNSSLDLKVQTAAGTLELNAQDRQGWRGQAKVDLKAPKGGQIQGSVLLEGLEKPALSGSIVAQQVQLDLADTPLTVNGQVLFSGQDFTLTGLLEAGGGKLRLEGDGAVADALPALRSVGLTQSDNGYQVRAALESVNLKNIRLRGLKLPDYLEGRVSGNATFAESVSTFTLRSEALTLAGEELPARLEGTFSGGNLRLRGGFGDSSASGSVTDGLLNARLELVRTPLHAFIGAFSGPLPGKSYATGAARYRGRLDDLLGGQLEAVAENLSVEGGSQSLRGYGQLEYVRGVLKIPNIVLEGAGSVRVRGEYSPQKVDFTADFINTSFTPLLRLVPALRTLEPSLKGTVKVKIGGTFEQPSAQVTSQNLEGSFAGIAVQSTGLGGSLTGNLLELAGTLNASSVFTATGQVNARANLSVRGLANTVITWTGKGKVDNFGPLEAVKATLTQNTGAERWTLQAAARQGGTISIGGEVAPRLILNFVAQGINPVISPLFIKSSTLNARGKFERLTGVEAVNTPLSSAVFTDPPLNSETSVSPDKTALEGTGNGPSVRQDRYRLSGGADFSSLLFGAVTTAATPAGPQAPTTPGGSNFVSPLPDELTTFPQAKTAVKRAPSFLEGLEFDNFDLNSSRGGVKVDENLARGEFTGRLTLSGTGATPRLAGKLTPVRGSVFLRENEFLLENDTTQITFDPSEGFYPRILLNARGLNKVRLRNRDVTLKVQVTGDFITVKTVTPLGDGTVGEAKEEKKLQLDTTLSTDTGISCSSSDLAAECGELYALLATGSSDLTNLTGNITQSALKTAVNVLIIGELERGIARALNLSVFRIRTNALDFDPDFKADFTVGTYLTKEFYVQYQVDLQGNGLLDAQYTTADGRFTFTVNTPLQWLDLSKAKPTFGLSYNLPLDSRSSIEFGVKTGAVGGNELKLLLNYRLSF